MNIFGTAMPMRKKVFQASALGMTVCGTLVTPLLAADQWDGSYAAQGQCFCVGEQMSSFGDSVVPTPIGGQSVSQICKTVGHGPALIKQEGLYNFPVYRDPQCGNPLTGKGSESSCVSAVSPNEADCSVPGPKWALEEAYAKVEQSVVADLSHSRVSDLLHGVESAPRYIDPLRGGGDTSASRPQAKIIVKQAQSDSQKLSETSTYVKKQSAQITQKKQKVKKMTTLNVPQVNGMEEALEAARARLKAQRGDLESTAETHVDRAENTEGLPLAEVLPVEGDSAPRRMELPDQTSKESHAHELEQLADESVATMNDTNQVEEAIGVAKSKLNESAAGIPEQAAAKPADPVIDEEPFPEANRAAKEAESVADDNDAVESASASISNNDSGSEPATAASNALRLPANVRASSGEFNYIEAIPVNVDFGGAGLNVEASTSTKEKLQYILAATAVENYKEASVGASYFFTSESTNRLTTVMQAGVEHGAFEFNRGDTSADVSDTGIFLSLSSRFVLNHLIELQAGVGYSSFFEGDSFAFGAGFLHITPKLDVTTKFEAGDNDLLGLGFRYYY